MERIKRAIFLAAGEGRRLRPVTLEMPKPLIKVHGKRMIDRSLEALNEYGIDEIYLVVGYKKEKFEEIYGNDPRIHFIENPDYQKGNNISSLYWARNYLPGAFVLEADLIIKDAAILNPEIEKSGYLASWMDYTTEWVLTVQAGRIINYETAAAGPGYRLWGVSVWNQRDGKRLAEDIAREYEAGNWGIFWDEVALNRCRETYDLGIREICSDVILEIDTFKELVTADNSYESYKEKRDENCGE